MTEAMDLKFVKVRLTCTFEGGPGVERPWARVVGPDQFALDNSPWFTDGLSLGDVVEGRFAERSGDVEIYDFVRLVRRGGRGTLRLIVKQGDYTQSQWDEFRRFLAALGADAESSGALPPLGGCSIVSVFFPRTYDAGAIARACHGRGLPIGGEVHVQYADVDLALPTIS